MPRLSRPRPHAHLPPGATIRLLGWLLCALSSAQAQAVAQDVAVPDSARAPAGDDLPAAVLQPLDHLDVRSLNLGDVLRAMAIQYNLNLMVDEAVRQPVTVRLSNVRVIDALRFLCEEYALDLHRTGDIFRITPRPEPAEPPPPPLPISVRDGRLTARLEDAELEAVIQALQTQSGRSFVIRQGASGRVSGFLQDAPFDTGLQTLLAGNGFVLHRRDGVYEIDRDGTMAETPGSSFRVAAYEDRVELDVVEANVIDVLRTLAAQLNLNVVTYGLDHIPTVTARFNGLTFDQTLDYLFKGTDLTYRNDDGIYLIGGKTVSGIAATRLIRLRHIKVDGLIDLLPETLLRQATIQVVPEQNALMVTGTNDVLAEVAAFIDQIDFPTPQILIEALVVDFEDVNARQAGLTLGTGTPPDSSSAGGFFRFGAGLNQQGGLTLQGGASAAVQSLNVLGGLLGVRTIGRLPDDFYFRIQAMEHQGIVNVRSRPQVATLNGHEASISIGTTQYFLLTTVTPYQSPTQIITQESQSFTEIEANVSLRITPWVGTSGVVTVRIQPEFNTPVGAFDAETPPTINSRVLDSTVRLKDGETIILGGLIQDVETRSFNKIPILGSIPLLGRLFRNRSTSTKKSELVIFVTPHVFYGDADESRKWQRLKEELHLDLDP